MSLWYLVLLALVQGLTEYLPVSSSAHLILLPRLLQTGDQGLVFDVAANTGTFLAAAVYFRKDLRLLVASMVGYFKGGERKDHGMDLARNIAIASLPVLISGWLLRDGIATVAREPLLIAVTSIGFGILLGWADRSGSRSRDLETLATGEAALVGLAQAVALVPGTSRSGITITAGLLLGLRREQSAYFSFLLALPVSAFAAASELLQLPREMMTTPVLGHLVLVVILSGVVGFAVIHLLLGFLRRRSLMIFVVYRILLGLVILVLVV